LKEIADLNKVPELFLGPLKTLWRATFGPRAAICPPLAYCNISIGFVFTCSLSYFLLCLFV